MRWGAFLLSTLLMFLFIWLSGFALQDIGNIEGPDYQLALSEHVDASALQRAAGLRRQISDLRRAVEGRQELQQDLRRSTDNARSTMQQMIELQRLRLRQGSAASAAQSEALATSQQRFLEAQERFESANAEIASSNATRFGLEQELREEEAAIEHREAPARAAYQQRLQAHRFRVAAWKLAFIVPLFLLAAWLFQRHRQSAYRPILLAALVATFWQVGQVMFEHFPRDYFKYIAIVAAIAIVLAFLVVLLRKAMRPDRDLLLTRYREAYRAHTCPICAFPIARGPLRFALWTRKGPRLPVASAELAPAPAADDAPYSCPSCGTTLFEACAACGGQRHVLLPFCEHCGDERPYAALASGD